MKKVTAVFIAAIIMLSACSSATLDSTGKEVVDAVKSVTDSENQYVLMVKGGYRESDPDLTYDKAFSTFFGTPRWSYFESDEGQDVVEFTGDCTYQEAPVKARIQFVVDEENGTFEATYLAFNEVPQDALTLTALITTAFDEAEKELESTSSESDTNTTANVPASGDEAVLAFKHWEVEHPIGWPYNITAINDNDPDSFNLDLWIDAEEYGTVSVKKSDGTMTMIATWLSETPLDINEWYETHWRSEYEKFVNGNSPVLETEGSDVITTYEAAVSAFQHWETLHPLGSPYAVEPDYNSMESTINLYLWIDGEQYDGMILVNREDGLMSMYAQWLSDKPISLDEWYNNVWMSVGDVSPEDLGY